MIKYICLCSFLLGAFFVSSQNIDCTIQLIDKNKLDILLCNIVVDDSIYITRDFESLSDDNLNIFKLSTKNGEHKISASIEDYLLIDTILSISPQCNNFILTIDLKDDFHLYEFEKGNYKMLYMKNYDTIIGLKEDGTFLRRSFFHTSIVGCFQFEKGKFDRDDNSLILDVIDYKSKCLKYTGEMKHRYIHTLKNDSISDIDKYNGFIEKKYMK